MKTENIEKIREMLANGEITEWDVPLGALRNNAQARNFLKRLEQKRNKTQEQKDYERILHLVDIIRAYDSLCAKRGEGHVGDFLDALCGCEEGKISSDYEKEVEEAWKEFRELAEKNYSYIKFVNDPKILSIARSAIGYTPIVV